MEPRPLVCADGGSLDRWLRSLPGGAADERTAKRVFNQIASAVRYCHKKHVCHRDLKPDNILLTGHQVG